MHLEKEHNQLEQHSVQNIPLPCKIFHVLQTVSGFSSSPKSNEFVLVKYPKSLSQSPNLLIIDILVSGSQSECCNSLVLNWTRDSISVTIFWLRIGYQNVNDWQIGISYQCLTPTFFLKFCLNPSIIHILVSISKQKRQGSIVLVTYSTSFTKFCPDLSIIVWNILITNKQVWKHNLHPP